MPCDYRLHIPKFKDGKKRPPAVFGTWVCTHPVSEAFVATYYQLGKCCEGVYMLCGLKEVNGKSIYKNRGK